MRRASRFRFAAISVAVFTIVIVTGILSCTNPLIDLVGTPEIRVKVNGEPIALDAKVDFGGVAGGASSGDFEFVIENVGKEDLLLPSGVVLDGDYVADFIFTQPEEVVAPNGATTFKVSFAPTGTSGTKTVYVIIETNDRFFETFSFSISGLCTSSVTTDTIRPTVTISSDIGDLTNVSPVPVTLEFSEPVYGFSASDLTVINGTAGTPVTTDNTTYTVEITQSTDPADIQVSLESDKVTDGADNGNTASNTLSYTYDSQVLTAEIEYDGTDPTNDDPIVVDVVFSDAVSGFNAEDITCGNCTASTPVTGDLSTYTVELTPLSDGNVTLDIADEAAQSIATSRYSQPVDSFSITYDGTAPTATISTTVSDPTDVSPIPVTITLSEEVAGFTVEDLAVTGGEASTLQTEDSMVFTTEITPSDDPVTVTVDLAADKVFDVAGNGNTAAEGISVEYDSSVPTAAVSFNTAIEEGELTNLTVVKVSVTFTEPVDGFTAGELYVDNGTASGLQVVNASEYTVNITPSEDGQVTIQVPAGVAQSAETDRDNVQSNSISFIYDGTNPTVSIYCDAGSVTGIQPIEIVVQFSEVVSGFIPSDLTLSTNVLASYPTTEDNQNYTINLTPQGDPVTITIDIDADKVADTAGNGNDAMASQFTVDYDTSVPTVLIVCDYSGITNESSFPITVQFSQAMANFTALSMDLTNCTASDPLSNDWISYQVTITPIEDGPVSIGIPAGAAQSAATERDNIALVTPFEITYDSTPPAVVTIDSEEGEVTNAAAIPVSITFSEEVSFLDTSQLVISSGSAGVASTTDDRTFEFTITDMADGDVTVSVPADIVTDTATNLNTASSSPFSILYDTANPNVSDIDSDEPDPTNAASFTVTVTFNEVMYGFDDAADVSVTNGSAAAPVSIDGYSYSTVITPDGDGLVTVSVADGVAGDAAGNLNNESSGAFTITYDSLAPTVTGLTTTADETTNATTIPVELVFSEAVVGFDSADLTITGGTAQTASTTDGVTYDFDVDISLVDEDDLIITIPANIVPDTAGNLNEAYATPLVVHYDPNAPGVVDVTSAETDPTSAYPMIVTVEFTEGIVDFDPDDLSLGNCTAGTFDTEDNITFDVEINALSDGPVTVGVPAGVFHDIGGNANFASDSSFEITYDGSGPLVTNLTADTPTNISPFVVSVGFSEPVTGFDSADDLDLLSGAAGAPYSVDGGAGLLYEFEVTPSGEGSIYISVRADAAVDESGNGNLGSGMLTVVYDITDPEVSSITTTTTSPTNDTVIPVQIEFEEDVTGLDTGLLTYGNCSYQTDSISGGGDTWSVNVVPTAPGAVTIGVLAGAATDGAGNTNEAYDPETLVTYDPNPPDVEAVSFSVSSPTNTSPIPAEIEFTEAIADFDPTQLSVGNGTAGESFTTSDNVTFSIEISPADDDEVTLGVPAGVFHDPAGNANLSTAGSAAITYDSTAPVATLIGPLVEPVNGPFTVAVRFDEDVTGLDSSGDLTVSSGTIGTPVQIDAKNYDVTVTPPASSEGTIDIYVYGDVAIDSAGNSNEWAGPLEVDYDTIAPVVVSITSEESDPTNNPAIQIDVVYSEAVTEVDPGSFVLGNCSYNDSHGGSLSGSGTSWSFYVEPIPTADTVTVGSSGGTATDLAGNADVFSPASFSIEFDITPPEATLTPANGMFFSLEPGFDTAVVEIAFSEPVMDISLMQLQPGCDDCIATSITRISDTTFEAEISPLSEAFFTGEFALFIPPGVAFDYAENTNVPSDFLVLFCDDIAPIGSITIDGADPTSSPMVDLTLNADDGPGSGVELMYVFNGIIPSPFFDWDTDADPYTPSVLNWLLSNPMMDGGKIVSVIFRDSAGNESEVYRDTVELDLTPPTCVITTDSYSKTSIDPIRYVVTWSEPVTDFDELSDVSKYPYFGGTLTTPTPIGGSQTEYEFYLMGPDEDSYTVYVEDGAAIDQIGNPNLGQVTGPEVEYVRPGTAIFNQGFSCHNSISTGLAEGANGDIYFGDTSGYLYAMDPEDGSKVWEFRTPSGNELVGYPAVGNDGTIYVCNVNGRLFAVDPTDLGDVKWENTDSNAYGAGPAIGFDGTVYTVDYNGSYLRAFNPSNGTLKWPSNCSISSYNYEAAPVVVEDVSSDGIIIIASTEGQISAYTDTGDGATQLWARYFGGSYGTPVGEPVPGNDGWVYVAVDGYGSEGRLIQYDANDGTPGFNKQFSYPFAGGMAFDASGYIYAGDNYNYFYKIDPANNGNHTTVRQTQEGVLTSPVVGYGDSFVYYIEDYGSSTQRFNAVEISTGNEEWSFSTYSNTDPNIGPLVTKSGLVYIVEPERNYVEAAVTATTAGPSQSPWPMERHDPRRTGRQDPSLLQ